MAGQGVSLPRPPLQTKVYPVLLVAGFLMVIASVAVMVTVATVAAGVFENPKAIRDAAEAGSALLANQGDLFTFPLWVKPFKLLGITFMWLGIITVLWGIRRTIREALATSMREGLPTLLKAKQGRDGTQGQS